jgi:hypothetical protein
MSVIVVSWFSALLWAQRVETQAPTTLNFYGQKIAATEAVVARYYDWIPYQYVTIRQDEQKTDDLIHLQLFFDKQEQMRRVEIAWSDPSKTFPLVALYIADTPVTNLPQQVNEKALFYIDYDGYYLDLKFKLRPEFKELALTIKVYGITRQSSFKLTKYLLENRDDKEANEQLLANLYKDGCTAILPLFKYENYSQLNLPQHSLFWLPEDTRFDLPIDDAMKLLQTNQYDSLEGIKRLPIIDTSHVQKLQIDNNKIKFLRYKNPQDTIIIKKIDLAQ